MNRPLKYLVSAALGAGALVSAIAVLKDSAVDVHAAADKLVMTEDEHSHDINLALEQLQIQNQSILETKQVISRLALKEDIREKNDLINRNTRELNRLKRDIAGKKYSNEGELAVMTHTMAEITMENERLAEEIKQLDERLGTVD